MQVAHVKPEACLRRMGLTPRQLHVIHWSGPRKPAYHQAPSAPSDALETEAYRAYRAEWTQWSARLERGVV